MGDEGIITTNMRKTYLPISNTGIQKSNDLDKPSQDLNDLEMTADGPKASSSFVDFATADDRDIIQEFEKVFRELSAEYFAQNDLSDFPTEILLYGLQERFDRIQRICKISPFEKDILRNTFFYGLSSATETNVNEFIVELANRLNARGMKNDAMKLVELVLKSCPEFYPALRFLETLLSDGSDVEKYLEVLKYLIKTGKNIGEDVSDYDCLLSRWERPAMNRAHATSIAYFEKIGTLQKTHPGSYITCNTKSFQIEVWIGDDKSPIESEQIEVDGHFVKIQFLPYKIEELCGRW